jgi:hypothetical protein
LSSVAQILPGHSIKYYLNELPYCVGLQLQSVGLAKNGTKFTTITTDETIVENIDNFFGL